MDSINVKKLKQLAPERHFKCSKQYSRKDFGVVRAVKCTDCNKWRRTSQYRESREVPEEWRCSLLTSENGEKGSCGDPEEQIEPFLVYCPGSVVWAKLNGYPWWPGMVESDPDTHDFSFTENDTLFYNVTFLDKKPTRAFIPEKFITSFLKPPEVVKGSVQKLKQNKHAKALSQAKKRAETAMKMKLKERLQAFSFVRLYKGCQPAASNIQECDIDENESRNIADGSHLLLKNTAELGSYNTTDNDEERIEKEENKETEEVKRIFKHSDISSPYDKKKKVKHSASIDITLSNAKYQTLVAYHEGIKNPIQERKNKLIRRLTKTTLRVRKLKNSTRCYVADIIDLSSSASEQSIWEKLKTVNFPQEEVSKTILDSNEKFITQGTKKEKFIKKYLYNEDFQLKHQDIVGCTESSNNPLRAKDTTEIIRIGNRKFTPRKKEESDHKCDKTCNTGFVSKAKANFLHSVNDSTLNIDKQKVTRANKHTEKSLKHVEPEASKNNEFPKQSNSSFSVSLRSKARQNELMIIDTIIAKNNKKKTTKARGKNKKNVKIQTSNQNQPMKPSR